MTLEVCSCPRVSIHRHLNPSRRLPCIRVIRGFGETVSRDLQPSGMPVFRCQSSRSLHVGGRAAVSWCPVLRCLNALAFPYRGVWTFLLSSRPYLSLFGSFRVYRLTVLRRPEPPCPTTLYPESKAPDEAARIPRLHREGEPGRGSWHAGPAGGVGIGAMNNRGMAFNSSSPRPGS